ELGDLAAVTDHDSRALELVDEVVGHGLAEVRAPMQEGDQSAAAGEPDRCLTGGVAAADHRHPRGAAELRLGRPGRVEDARALVLGKTVEGKPPVLGAGGENNRAGGDFMSLLEAHDVAAAARLERDGAIWGGRPRAELPRLGHGAARELGAADPGRKAEVVLDPARRSRLAAE